jgi:2-dehydropantoate 2-reductase
MIGAVLAKAGESVTLIVRPESVKDYPAELSLDSPLGSFRVPVEHAGSVAQPFEVLWVAVKATQLDSALRSVDVDPGRLGAVVPLLNGIDHIALLRARFGHDRVVPATIAVEAERAAPGKIVHRGTLARLTISAIGESRLASTIDQLRKFGLTCQFDADEMKILWTKLALLAPFALTTTAARRTIGEVLHDPEWRQRLEAGVREACAVATATGVSLDAASFIQFFSKMPPGGRSSMQKDVAAGNPPELDAIAGPILRGARQHGLRVPVIQELAAMIQGKPARVND